MLTFEYIIESEENDGAEKGDTYGICES